MAICRGTRPEPYIKKPSKSPFATPAKETGAEQERSVVQRDQRPADGDERGGICARAREVLPQGHDR
jgi:hypothetical protein